MTISLKHNYQSTLPDDNVSSTVGSTEWNEEHVLLVGTGKLIGRYSGTDGAAEEITPGNGIEIDTSGNLRTGAETIETVSGTTPDLDPANGTMKLWTLSGNSTPTITMDNGESFTLMVDDGTAYTITWPTMTWLSNGGTEVTLRTSGYTLIVIWKVAGTIYGFGANGA